MEVIEGRELQVPDAVYAYQLDGKGGVTSIDYDDKVTCDEPCWLHLDYAHPASAEWLATTPLLPDAVREALSGESSRPRVSKVGDGTMITLRSINFNANSRPDQLVTIRVYMTDKLIVSTRHRKVFSIDQVVNDLQSGIGPTNSGNWLVEISDALTDHASEFIEDLHDKIIDLEDSLLEQQVPERGQLALIRKQLIVLRRYMAPQRDVFSRLASDRLPWMNDDDRRRMQDIADRLGRGLDDLDGSIARTAILSDEITTVMADAMNRRTYTMSLLAMVFLPTTFLTGLFGVNLGGIPGGDNPFGFATFCLTLTGLVFGLGWWLKRRRWL
ncbi:Zinc transport protein ZntB [Serratia quinivorans]|jgi:zinc transporter|uniref:zinc transporter ZntB n=1 Tax=Serratia TaxID=613 RepID=UPI0021795DC9|nr:zinc transporter ZntB [Serratia quinivorans]CAI0911693.1 Zinc transport protein ZntB [Serratia quinivorans]CAI1534808.1 Zinc transport protein ZntB [Serratia quinivorans]CAI1607828.1 Zinc transport protein ZntB [Serratia quinivorans]CAI1653634.1 Zinc transport protein ZntB [Serratia quinivorans]